MTAHPSNGGTVTQVDSIQHLPSPPHPPTVDGASESGHDVEVVKERTPPRW